MIPTVLVIFGIVLMIWSVFLCARLPGEVGKYSSKIPWYILLVLVCFFLAGYTVFLYLLVVERMELGFVAYLLGIIFFFGAVFVVSVLKVNDRLIRTLNDHTNEILEKNKILQLTSDELSLRKNELEKVKLALEKKNNDLEETLEDFYTMRLGLMKDMETGTVGEENKKIRERIDAIKQRS
jgi:hypothetical protein